MCFVHLRISSLKNKVKLYNCVYVYLAFTFFYKEAIFCQGLFVCWQPNSKGYWWVLIRFSGNAMGPVFGILHKKSNWS